MGIRVIGQKKFEVTETELLQQDLLFYLDNPRVYSVLHENGHDNPTQTEIEEIMCSLDHVKSLKSQIMQNGGLIEPLIVVKRKDRYMCARLHCVQGQGLIICPITFYTMERISLVKGTLIMRIHQRTYSIACT